MSTGRLIVGLTGGIGSGKSTVADLLRNHGADVVDADLVAREILSPGQPAFSEVVAHFGPDVISPTGEINRPVLAAKVFGNPDELAVLNAMTHPRISQSATEQLAAAAGPVVVYEHPLLVESAGMSACDVVVVVDVPDDVRLDRLVGRGMTAGDARARMAAQARREDRIAVADWVIDNSGDREQLAQQVDSLWHELHQRVDSVG